MNALMERTQELEIITTAYFLEERIEELKHDISQLQNIKPNKPKFPIEPHPEKQNIEPIPYPDVKVEPVKINSKWKIIILSGIVVDILCIFTNSFMGFVIGTIAFWAGIIYGFKIRNAEQEEEKRLEVEVIAQIKASPEYIQQCQEIDEENRVRQMEKDDELHNKYLSRYDEYKKSMQQYELDLKQYEEYELPEWSNENTELLTVLNDVRETLQEVYNKNIIPIQYRKKEALAYLAIFLNTSQYDLKFAIENYNQYVTQCKQDKHISVAEAQLHILNETLENQQYSNWLNEQLLDINEQGNKTLKSIDNWQKADISYRTYEKVKQKRAMKKAGK